jgi:hypothetical protein
LLKLEEAVAHNQAFAQEQSVITVTDGGEINIDVTLGGDEEVKYSKDKGMASPR